MFNLTSPLKANSVSFIFRESERTRKKTPKGPFSYDLVPKARKSINHTLENSSSHDWMECSFFVNSPIRTEKEITYRWKDDSSNTFTSMKETSTRQSFHI